MPLLVDVSRRSLCSVLLKVSHTMNDEYDIV